MRLITRAIAAALLPLLLAGGELVAQTRTPPPAGAETASTPAPLPYAAVVLHGDTLFHYNTPLGPFSAEDRAASVMARLQRLADDPVRGLEPVQIVEGDVTTDLIVGDVVITSITESDAAAAGLSRQALATERAAIIEAALHDRGVAAQIRVILLGVLFALLTAGATFLVFRLVNRIFPRIFAAIEGGRDGWIPAVRVQRTEIVSADSVARTLLAIARFARLVITVLLLYITIPIVLSFFPWTRAYADQLFGYILTPFARVWGSFLAFLPDLFTIGAIAVVTWYLLKLIRPIFIGLKRQTITIGGFYPEWAMPTYQIVRVLVILFAFIAVWPYLPGSDSPAFQGVGVFVGLLLSLGSATAIGNMVGGIVITYMRPFKLGDRVKIADTVGDVIEKSLLVTRVRTPKNVDITIPNAMVLGSHIVNYSSSARRRRG
jgi:small-conductance mechanosensitive channel